MTMNHFKGKQFQQDVIIVAVGYYLRYNLSYREVQEILYDRGINVSHTTIYRWVQEYGKLLYQIWKKKNNEIIHSINQTVNNSANYLKRIPIPKINEIERQQLNKLVLGIVDNHEDNQRELDELFDRLYAKLR
uniref:Truncated transposase A n=1 Tax=Streptococcus dysgalactiae subsp. equisimilis TaxID=119602 RepID=B1NNY3_STREQ|nr:truncated transposase A [Streptococcus dysgalactiae subsp. equisimilis]